MAYFSEVKNIIDLKSEYLKLMKIYHPDVTFIKEDTTEIVQEINDEYQVILARVRDTNNEILESYTPEKTENLYVNVYMAKAHIKRVDGTMSRYFKLECVNSYLVKDQFDAERVVKNLKKQKAYDFLSANNVYKCDRNGYVAAIETGGVYLSHFFHSYSADERKTVITSIR